MDQEKIARVMALVEDIPHHEEAARLLDNGLEKRIVDLSSFEARESVVEEFDQFPTSLQNSCLMLSAARSCRDNKKFWRNHWHVPEIDWFLSHSRSVTDETFAKLITMGLIYVEGQKLVYEALASCPVGFTPILNAVEKRNDTAAFSTALRSAVTNLRNCVIGGKAQRDARLAARLQRMLHYGSAVAPFGIRGEFATRLSAWVETLDGTQRSVWTELINLAVGLEHGEDRRLWKEIKFDAAQKTKQLDAETFTADVIALLEFASPPPSYAYDFSLSVFVQLLSLFKVESFAIDWAPFVGQGELLAGPVGVLYGSWSSPEVAAQRNHWVTGGENPFSRQRGRIQNSLRSALTGMAEGPKAISELLRIRAATESEYQQDDIDKKLGELALRHGKSIKALLDEEDVELPDFGLGADGSLSVNVGKSTATLSISAADVEVTWINEAGKAVRSAPAAVRRNHAAEFTAFKQQAKELRHEYRRQIARLQQGWLDGSSWGLTNWNEHYLNHPLRRPGVEALIWRIEHGDRRASVLPAAGRLLDMRGKEVSFPSEARVRLWHPLDEAPDEVLAWRERIIDAGITQPIKQAHREIYVLTDAERKTAVYSNRFAAHILRKHQLNALRKTCGWNTDGYNDFADPERRLPELGIRAEFQMEWVGNEHVATDQVRFLKPGSKGEAINLDRVPPVVFSEVMRDCDLFVAVASVANDPTWSDGGPEGRHRDYWHDWAFGDLGQSARVRRELIERFAGGLSIADKLEIGEKALIVAGKRQKYAIHFGSTNVQILPDNRYLCIVPDRLAPEADRVRLPFTGDSQVSTILAKAFMLADDDRITDTTILSQL